MIYRKEEFEEAIRDYLDIINENDVQIIWERYRDSNLTIWQAVLDYLGFDELRAKRTIVRKGKFYHDTIYFNKKGDFLLETECNQNYNPNFGYRYKIIESSPIKDKEAKVEN